MKTIDIAQILSPDLKSRMRAQDLKLLIENSEEKEVVLDFQGVKFATRSFIDEFYNLFLKSPTTNDFQVELTNVPEDIKTILDAVSRTQVRAKAGALFDLIPDHHYRERGVQHPHLAQTLSPWP